MMNFIRQIVPSACKLLHRCSAQNLHGVHDVQRSFSILTAAVCPVSKLPAPHDATSDITVLSGQPTATHLEHVRTYKVRTKLKRRCAGCYFERRFGRLYVECSLKPRHKQMQLLSGFKVFKDDYCKGKWKKAQIWGYTNRKFYEYNNKFSQYKWLGDRIGKDL